MTPPRPMQIPEHGDDNDSNSQERTTHLMNNAAKVDIERNGLFEMTMRTRAE
jgi:hypothetical protein